MAAETFAKRLSQAMKAQNVKQVDVLRAAEQAGIKLGKSHISQYVSGKTLPREHILNFLASFLQETDEFPFKRARVCVP